MLRRFFRAEPIVLSAVLLIAVCLFGFLHLANVIRGQRSFTFDEQLLLSFRNAADLTDPVGSALVESAMVDVSALGSFIVTMIVFVSSLGFLALRRQYRLCVFVFFSVLGGTGLAVLLKSLFMRPRPELVTHLTEAHLSSFPSGHSMSSAVLYLTLAALLAETFKQRHIKLYILFWAVLIVLMVGVSRVYIGVHWPSDVLAGWMGGAAWALFCWVIERTIRSTLLKRKVLTANK